MKLEFHDPRLDRLESDAGFDGDWDDSIVRVFRKRVQLIRNAEDERTLREYKSLHFEKLKGDRAHQHSVRLNRKYRLILELSGQGPCKVVVVIGIEDYH